MFTLRNMQIEDYNKVYSLWQNTPGICLRQDDSLENIHKFLNYNAGLSFVCENNQEIIGAVLCGHDSKRGFLYHLAVKKDFQKQGLGTLLVEQCLLALKKIKINKCHIFLMHDNKEGAIFWEQLSFKKRQDILVFSKDI